MRMLYPLMLDGEQPVDDVRAMLLDADTPRATDYVLIRYRERLRVCWSVATRAQVLAACDTTAHGDTLATAMLVAPFHLGADTAFAEAERVELATLERESAGHTGWLVVFSGSRFVGVANGGALDPGFGRSRVTREVELTPTVAPPPAASSLPARPPASAVEAAPTVPAPAESAPRGQRRSRPRNPPDDVPRSAPPIENERPLPAGASPETIGAPLSAGHGNGTGATETLLATARVDAPAAIAPSPTASATIVIGLAPAPSPSDEGVMRFTSSVTDTRIDIGVMVEAPDFTSTTGWKHTLTVLKSDPFAASVMVVLVPLAPEDRRVHLATVRVHYTYRGQPAGMVVRTIALGDSTAAEVASIEQPRNPALAISGTDTPVDLTIRIARRDQSESARDLIWTVVDCAHPSVVLPSEALVRKVGDRDNASSFASMVTRQVNAADGTVTIDSVLNSFGTLVRRAMPPQVLQVLAATAAAVGPTRLARVLLLTDECHIPWELAYFDSPINPARAPYLGAQYAVSRWIHGEDDIPVPPPATLTVRDLAIVLGSYESSNLAELPHAKDETAALTEQATSTPTLFPRVTSVAATADALVDLLNGALPAATGPLAPEMVHFACHGEVLGTGVSKRSVLYLNDGTPLQETLFVSSKLARTSKSFLFMNACQVGVGGEELGQYAGFAGFAIGAGFSGFIGPLWSVNDEVAKRIAVDFYQRTFGTDGSAPRPVADVLADMRSQYLSEPDPKKRQSTWLAYVHYGHPHFTLAHA